MKKNQSVERAFMILEVLDSMEDGGGLGVNEIAKLIGLKAPTTHNFLQTLTSLGYLDQNEHCKYRLAERIKWLGWDGRRKLALLNAARPYAERLALDLNEVVIVCARSGWFWQTLVKFESSHMLTAKSDLPVTGNFYISATGRCILSQLPEKELELLVSHFRLPAADEWTGAETWEGMLAALEKIRRDRYELYHTGNGITGVGALIKPSGHAATGALGIIIPSFRFEGEHRNAVLKGILSAAEMIGKSKF